MATYRLGDKDYPSTKGWPKAIAAWKEKHKTFYPPPYTDAVSVREAWRRAQPIIRRRLFVARWVQRYQMTRCWLAGGHDYHVITFNWRNQPKIQHTAMTCRRCGSLNPVDKPEVW